MTKKKGIFSSSGNTATQEIKANKKASLLEVAIAKKLEAEKLEAEKLEAEKLEAEGVEAKKLTADNSKEKKLGFFARFRQRLSKTRLNIGSGLFSLLKGKKIDDDLF